MTIVATNLAQEQRDAVVTDVGRQMYALVARLFPICRSITGPGVRESLEIVQEHVPLELHEVPSGTRVFDWEVPREWRIRDAYVADSQGRRLIDFARCNLHVVNYSVPFDAKLAWRDLKRHLFTLPERPDWIPYRTSYYRESWGFCLSHRQYLELNRRYREDDELEVRIDADLEPGCLTYGELFVPGETEQEVLFSCHVCHPSLANDNLSGIAVATHLAQYVAALPRRRYSYRFLFIPGTIGAIAWLALNEAVTQRIVHGMVLALLGDSGKLHYKQSRRGDAAIDRAVAHALKHSGHDFAVLDFEPYGYDERQFCSPGFNLPVGCLSRTPYGRYPEYHTSADNLDLVSPAALAGSLAVCTSIVEVLEGNRAYVNQNPKGEPQLGRRGLFSAMGGGQDKKEIELALLWVLNLSDGQHTLLDIAARSGLAFGLIRRAADLLMNHQLLLEQDTTVPR